MSTASRGTRNNRVGVKCFRWSSWDGEIRRQDDAVRSPRFQYESPHRTDAAPIALCARSRPYAGQRDRVDYECMRFVWALFYWNARKTWFHLRGAHQDDCLPDLTVTPDGPYDSRCGLVSAWHEPRSGSGRSRLLLVQT